MRFKDLEPGQAFIFASERDIPHWQGARGPWIKIGKRAYVRLRYDGTINVGTINVGTINVEVYPHT